MSVAPGQNRAGKARMRRTTSLLVPRESGLYATARSFWNLCAANRDLRLERTAQGEVIVMAPAGMDAGMRNAGLTAQLWNWNRQSGLGVVFDSSSGFTLPNRSVKAADASWMTTQRWNAIPARQRKTFCLVCPDFVVEIISPSDSLKKTRAKMVEYLAQGVRLGWQLDPKSGRVEIYRTGQAVEARARPATLSGEDVLPGFVLDLQGILFD